MLKISYISTYFPEKIIDFTSNHNINPEWNWERIIKATGVEKVHQAAEDEFAVDMVRKAAEKLFEENNIDRNTIDYVILSSLNNHFVIPSPVYLLHKQLGLGENVGVNYFKIGCSGFVHALLATQGLFQSNVAKRVLIVTSTAVRKYLHPKNQGSFALFGDAATAVIVDKIEGAKHLPFVMGTQGANYDDIIIKDGDEAFRYSEESFIDKKDIFGNIYSDGTLYFNSLNTFSASFSKTKNMFDELEKKHSVNLDSIDKYIFHQSSALTLASLQKRLKIDQEKMIIEIKNWGNTVCSSMPIALNESEKKGIIKRGDKIMLSAFGIGFSWMSTIIEY